MHPHYWNRPRFFWGPSRIIWFAIGATAATWYHHSKDPERKRICAERYRQWASAALPPPPPPPPQHREIDERWQRPSTMPNRAEDQPYAQPALPAQAWEHTRPQEPTPPATELRLETSPPSLPTPPQAREPVQSTWEWDSRAADNVVAEISRRASETLTELSSALQSINAKMAEREAERKELEKKREEERANPSRWV